MYKKTYMAPEVDITLISTDFHICIGSGNKEIPTDLPGDDVHNGGDNPGNFSRRRSEWDDEDEYDY